MKKSKPYLYYRYIHSGNMFGKKIQMGFRTIDVVIPIVKKDLQILPYCLEGIRKNLMYPIRNIILISPLDDNIVLFAEKHNCKFIDEKTVLPFTPKDIDYTVNGENRAGWLFQQLLKMSVDKVSDLDYVYVIDADTILVQPQRFDKCNKNIFLISDEYHKPYYEMYKKIFDRNHVQPFSFVSHQMLIDTKKLTLLKQALERKNEDIWYNAIIKKIDKTQVSGFSEFETIGNWMVNNYPKDFIYEYWFNLSLKRSDINSFINAKIDLSKYRSVSFQSWNI